MKREIKFRLWDTVNNFFVGAILDGTYSHPNDFFSSEALVPTQYTGIKDKHGKEIYEGDILKWDNHPLLSEVRWISEDDGWDYSGWLFTPLSTQYGPMEIIGNIYEDLELIR